MVLGYYEGKPKIERVEVPPAERLKGIDLEINETLTEEKAMEESMRCMSCGDCFDCGTCWSYCQDQAILKPVTKYGEYKFKMDFCNGCKKCAENCPCGFLEMK
jgi:Pyruvate/2-oxoacid:ferredoxin oxidoreductase delta subunit